MWEKRTFVICDSTEEDKKVLGVLLTEGHTKETNIELNKVILLNGKKYLKSETRTYFSLVYPENTIVTSSLFTHLVSELNIIFLLWVLGFSF